MESSRTPPAVRASGTAGGLARSAAAGQKLPRSRSTKRSVRRPCCWVDAPTSSWPRSNLKQRLAGDIVVAGSFHLVHVLLEHELVDELRLMVYPVVLGMGKRLFAETSDKKPLRLVGNRTVAGDLALLTYQPVGKT